jgi:hypothetical protein
MTENTNATSVPDQDALNISVTQLAAIELPTNPSTNDDSVVFVAEPDGEWEDPRKVVTGKFVEDYGEKINAVGKLQRSITIMLPDGGTMLVSAFGAKAKQLEGRKLGGTYTFKGKLKSKTETFLGKEKTSRFLNL